MKLERLLKSKNISLDKRIATKSYLTVKEKFQFIDEYQKLLNMHIDDYKQYESFVAIIFFDLLVVKYYSDIELELTYEEYDLLQENKIFDKLMENIIDDYQMLIRLVRIKGDSSEHKQNS